MLVCRSHIAFLPHHSNHRCSKLSPDPAMWVVSCKATGYVIKTVRTTYTRRITTAGLPASHSWPALFTSLLNSEQRARSAVSMLERQLIRSSFRLRSASFFLRLCQNVLDTLTKLCCYVDMSIAFQPAPLTSDNLRTQALITHQQAQHLPNYITVLSR